ncbi:unnamed protein product [Larinioides sclopetarius]|uniref:SMB domain-containing protein n=1 Tax=Larinioides sclopetarius TaxID=280406 RepID=A0AAV2AJB7_9ARAC
MRGYKFYQNMIYLSISGVLTVFLLIGSHALEYSLLENLELTCLPRDNCMLVQQHQASFENRSCECDSLCNVFRDCCIDKANLAPLAPSRIRKYLCMVFGGQYKVGVYVVDTCPHNYRASATIRSLCQEGDDFSDPLMSAPATLVSAGTTFRNRYCAECNGASPSSLESWMVYMNCETLIPLRLNDSYIWQNVKYNFSLRTWGVKIGDEFHKCEVLFNKPQNLSAVRFCRTTTIDSCPSSFLRASVKRLCASYSAVVYDTVNAYKNPHCAICNNKRATDLICLDSSMFTRNANRPFTFAHLLDVNRRDGDVVGMVERCPSGEKWDPFFKKCRKLTCALPGYQIVGGKCKRG